MGPEGVKARDGLIELYAQARPVGHERAPVDDLLARDGHLAAPGRFGDAVLQDAKAGDGGKAQQ